MKEAKEEKKEDLLELSKEDALKLLAYKCQIILASPKGKSGELTQLLELCFHERVQREAIVSLAAVFKDILPSKKVIEPQEQATEGTKRKVTEDMRLLLVYREFLDILKKGTERQHNARIRSACIRAAGELLRARPEFNYRSEVAKILVKALNDKNDEIHTRTASQLTQLFSSDVLSYCTLDVVTQAAEFLKSRMVSARPDYLAPFMTIEIDPKIKDVDPTQMSIPRLKNKEKRKIGKSNVEKLNEMRRIEEQEKRLSAKQDEKALLDTHTRIVTKLFVIFSRALNHAINDEDGSGRCPLLVETLAGYAKFGHLVSIAYLLDVLNLLGNLALGDLPAKARFACLHTAATVLHGTDDTLKQDMRMFYRALYEALPALPELCDADVTQAAATVRLLLLSRKQLGVDRVAAFVKRLLQTTLMCTRKPVAVALVDLAGQLLQRYPASRCILDTEQQYSAAYSADATDPDCANARCSLAWELTLVRDMRWGACGKGVDRIMGLPL